MSLVTELWAGFVTTDHRPPQHCLLSRDGPPREAAAESIRRTVWTQGCTLGWWGTHRRPGPPWAARYPKAEGAGEVQARAAPASGGRGNGADEEQARCCGLYQRD